MVVTGSGSKSWSRSLPDSMSQHVHLMLLDVDELSKVSFPSYWHILGLSIVFSILGVRGGQGSLKSVDGGWLAPPSVVFAD